MGDSAGTERRDGSERSGLRHQDSAPRPRRQVHCLLRRDLLERGRGGDPNPDPGAEGERLCRAVGADRPGGVPGLDAGVWPVPSAVVAARLRSPLQPAATTPQPHPGRPRTCGAGTGLAEGQPSSGAASRCARRPRPRVSRGRSMMDSGFPRPTAWFTSTTRSGHDVRVSEPNGGANAAQAFRSDLAGPVAGYLLLALLSVAAGVVALLGPRITAFVLTIWVAVWA